VPNDALVRNRLATRQSRQAEQYHKHGDEDGDGYDCELCFIAHCRPVPCLALCGRKKHIENSTVSPRMRTTPDTQRPMMVAHDIPHQRQAHTVTIAFGADGFFENLMQQFWRHS
jgi:hypothetical protein